MRDRIEICKKLHSKIVRVQDQIDTLEAVLTHPRAASTDKLNVQTSPQNVTEEQIIALSDLKANCTKKMLEWMSEYNSIMADAEQVLTEAELNVVHYYVNGWQHYDIGIKLGYTEQTCRTYLMKARKKLCAAKS